jgi:hypothetical protein
VSTLVRSGLLTDCSRVRTDDAVGCSPTVPESARTTQCHRQLVRESFAESRPGAIGPRSRLVGIRGAAFAPRDQRPGGTATLETMHFPAIHAL